MELFIAAFITGLVGSLHCAGMCGPLAMTFHLKGNSNSFLPAFLYNFSRITAYGILGIITGALGYGIFLAGWQQALSIATGILILLFIVGRKWIEKGNMHPMQRWTRRVQSGIKNQMNKNSLVSNLALGFLNGWLPCGLVYLALAGAVTTGGMMSGGIYMLLFGLGNFPVMFAFAAGGTFFSHSRLRIRKILPMFSILIALLLIIRGLNLGIPYLSPYFEASTDSVVCCDPVIQ